jgi:IS5 family transposase
MHRINLMKHWTSLNDPAMDDALIEMHKMPLFLG